MAIANAVQRSGWVYVYDEKGRQLCMLQGSGGGPNDGLTGYTSTTVNIKRNGWIYTYNEKGQQTAMTPAR